MQEEGWLEKWPLGAVHLLSQPWPTPSFVRRGCTAGDFLQRVLRAELSASDAEIEILLDIQSPILEYVFSH